jgi:hypothetical protein
MALFGCDIALFIMFLGLIATALLSFKLKISDSSLPSSFMYYPIGNKGVLKNTELFK